MMIGWNGMNPMLPSLHAKENVEKAERKQVFDSEMIVQGYSLTSQNVQECFFQSVLRMGRDPFSSDDDRAEQLLSLLCGLFF